MNVFRLAGDYSHLLAIIILLFNICMTKSCAGISGRSQILFVLVYTTRYLDLFSYFISTYNTLLKIIFIGIPLVTVCLTYSKFKATYDRNHDTFRIEFLLIPVVILALIVNHDFAMLEILWTFSVYLESVAIIPQLSMVSKTGEAKTIVLHYLFCLVSYKGFYILNWVYRYYAEGFYDVIAIVAGVVQTTLYCNFFYLYKCTWKQSLLPVTIKDQNILKSKEQDLCIWSPPPSASEKSYQFFYHYLDFQKDNNTAIFQMLTDFIKENCTTQDFISTDASKSQNRISIGIISFDLIISNNLSSTSFTDSNYNSNFSVEALALLQAINQLPEQKERFIILSDNKSSFNSLALVNNKSPTIILDIHKNLQSFASSDCDIKLIWIPSLGASISTNQPTEQLET